ncbi:hypothetical protein J2T49_003783 [Pseudomonas nitroreducens]|nr:hypothetical protein [Pseudomonas nitroreducens]MCP1687818.1 hypothetical protein [Pseudomonas nitroreducens]
MQQFRDPKCVTYVSRHLLPMSPGRTRSDTHAVRASESMGIATLHAILRTLLDHTPGSGRWNEPHPRQVLPDQELRKWKRHPKVPLRTVGRMGGAQRYPCCPCIGIDGYRYAPRHPANTARPHLRQRAPERAASTAGSAGSGALEMEKAPEGASCVRSVGWVERSDTHAVRASESMGIATLHAILRTPLDHPSGSGRRNERHPRQVLPDQRATALARAWCSFL